MAGRKMQPPKYAIRYVDPEKDGIRIGLAEGVDVRAAADAYKNHLTGLLNNRKMRYGSLKIFSTESDVCIYATPESPKEKRALAGILEEYKGLLGKFVVPAKGASDKRQPEFDEIEPDDDEELL